MFSRPRHVSIVMSRGILSLPASCVWRATYGGVNVVVEIVGVDIEITVQSNPESVQRLSVRWKNVRKNASWLLLLWLCWHDAVMG